MLNILIANNKRGGARRRTKRSVQRRNNAPNGNGFATKSNGFAQDTRVVRLTQGRNLVYGFPDRMQTKLRYNQTVDLISGGGALVGSRLFRMNDITIPTASGHQPMYRDTYAAIYENYAVVASRLTVKFINTSATNVFKVGAAIDSGISTSSNATELCERSHGQHTILPPLAGSLSSRTFTVPWNCRTILGIDPYTSDQYKTPITSSPTNMSEVQIWVLDLTTGTSGITLDVTIEYDVLFTELSTPATS